MKEITDLINTVGFPIALCIVAVWYNARTNNRIMDESKAREERLIQQSVNREDKFFAQFAKYDETMDKFNSTLLTLDKRMENIENKLEGVSNGKEKINVQ